MPDWKKLLLSIGACYLPAIFGGFFTATAVKTWYPTLVRPDFSPPNWVFGPAWTILYFLMAISLYLVWTKGITNKAAKIFGIQLALNGIWSMLFFGFQMPLLAFIEIVLLWIFILWSIIEFYKIDKRAAYLLIPYILWVSFAAVLNLFIVLLN